MEEKDKVYTEGIRPQGKFYKWFDNYWYHYKWITIGVIFAIFIVTVCTLQTCERKKEDTTILYAGPCQLSVSEMDSIKGVVSAVMPKDYDGDGNKYTGMIEYWLCSEEQVKDIEASTDEYGAHGYVNRQQLKDNYESYYDYLMAGETAICFLDPHLYTELKRAGRLLPLVDALGADSGYEPDDYGIVLGLTEIYEEYSALRAMPEDTVVCVLRQVVVGRISNDKNYQNDLEIFEAIVMYSEKEQ